jgi:hypothetical protein
VIAVRIELGVRMKVNLEWEFNDEELAAIANHLGEATVDAHNVLDFIKNAVSDAIESAIVEYRAAQNDPSTSVGP